MWPCQSVSTLKWKQHAHDPGPENPVVINIICPFCQLAVVARHLQKPSTASRPWILKTNPVSGQRRCHQLRRLKPAPPEGDPVHCPKRAPITVFSPLLEVRSDMSPTEEKPKMMRWKTKSPQHHLQQRRQQL